MRIRSAGAAATTKTSPNHRAVSPIETVALSEGDATQQKEARDEGHDDARKAATRYSLRAVMILSRAYAGGVSDR
jgi:hypothetical protein